MLMMLAVWAQAATVFAQRRGPAEEPAPPEKSYILPYVVVVLCVALGLMVVCRSGGRSNEPKLEDLE
jgi:hypothetical protein